MSEECVGRGLIIQLSKSRGLNVLFLVSLMRFNFLILQLLLKKHTESDSSPKADLNEEFAGKLLSVWTQIVSVPFPSKLRSNRNVLIFVTCVSVFIEERVQD